MRFRTLTLTSLLALASTASNAFADACQATYSYTGAIVDCTVLTTDSYSITAYGAQGGTGLAGAGGLGAEVAEDITINAGDSLEIPVGGMGGAGGRGGGAGGGSFVSGALTQLIGAENAGNGLVYIAEGSSIQLPGSGSTTVPEPASLAIFGVSLIGLDAIRLRFQAR
jgi:hypothetical protein